MPMAVLAFGESPRWHDDRLWFSDWGAQAVVAADLESKRELMLRGADNRTLFIMAAEWRGTASMADAAQTGQGADRSGTRTGRRMAVGAEKVDRRGGHSIAVPAILVHDFLPVVALRKIGIVGTTEKLSTQTFHRSTLSRGGHGAWKGSTGFVASPTRT